MERMRQRYGAEATQAEKPQQKALRKDWLLSELLEKASAALGCAVQDLRRSRRGWRNENRDLLIYSLWNSGLYRNEEIGEVLGIGASAVSQRVKETQETIAESPSLQRKLRHLTAQMKM